jgi:two-component system, chemotaxis family, protein-glutamate methylesterase/glutaminase
MPPPPDARTGIVGLAASAGGLAAIIHILSALPEDMDAAVLVVMHLLPDHRSSLPEVLARNTDLWVRAGGDADEIEPGHVYVATPDTHLVVDDRGLLCLDAGPVVHHVRPAADRLFQSMAASYGPDALAVVLTGTGCDGAEGVEAVKREGGHVVVQDPESSEHRGMPTAAIATGCADEILPLARIPRAILDFVSARQPA